MFWNFQIIIIELFISVSYIFIWAREYIYISTGSILTNAPALLIWSREQGCLGHASLVASMLWVEYHIFFNLIWYKRIWRDTTYLPVDSDSVLNHVLWNIVSQRLCCFKSEILYRKNKITQIYFKVYYHAYHISGKNNVNILHCQNISWMISIIWNLQVWYISIQSHLPHVDLVSHVWHICQPDCILNHYYTTRTTKAEALFYL